MPDPATDPSPKPLAVLIDADNASASKIANVLSEIATYGTANVKRIYGDWAATNLASWKDVLLEHSIQPVQQFAYTKGKNATDIAMIIDAMDLLYTGRFSGFCLVTSDSDFTPLAMRIREQGLTVYGIGEKKTPQPFVRACNKFVYTEVLSAISESAAEGDEAASAIQKKTGAELRKDQALISVFRRAIDSVTDDEEWVSLGGVGSTIRKLMPEFDHRFYGYSKLKDLLVATGLFDVETKNQHPHVREKPKKG